MEAIKSQLDSVLAKLESNEALISDVKSMKEAGEEFRKSLSAETAKLNEKADALQAQLDGVDARTQAGFASAAKGYSFSSELEKAFASDAFGNYKSGNANKVKLDLELKGGDMTIGNSYTGEVIPAERVPDLKFTPNRKVNVRQLLPVGQTSSNLIRFVRESGGIEYTRQAMYRFRQEALDILDTLPDNPSREAMRELLVYVTERKK